ncbi:MAG: MetQ/NlpA family ABC transporter substrate-binding protein [Synergistaceae bacterium]|jgi:D-methionine transport system substrate-binding protein|nr:MetQ/NlpA family ABC transporter substrate-binding protein [Synergistaceae bacterium]
MKSISRILLLAAVLFAVSLPAAFAAEPVKLVIGVTPFPHAEIVKIAAPLLKAEGYEVEIKEFNDYVTPNIALADGSLAANFFQHIPYLENMASEQKLDLVWVAKVHIEPLGLYSKKIKAVSGIKNGDSIAIPNDPTNGARALRLIEKAGLIKVKEGDLVTARDITENTKNLKIVELEAAALPRTLDDTTASVINTNYAVEANLIPSRDALTIEDKDSPYANVVAVRKADVDKPEIKALVKAINSPEVKKFIEDELVPKGIVPAF